MDLIPKLNNAEQLAMTVTNNKHYSSQGTVGFKGTRAYAGIIANSSTVNMLAGDDAKTVAGGAAVGELGKRIGSDAVLRANANVTNFGKGVSFADEMLKAIDKVSTGQNTVGELVEAAIIDPDSVDVHDITIAEAEASMSLGIARTVLSRITQAWRDITNAR
jgi:flagellar hook-basal body complex protein FliE